MVGLLLSHADTCSAPYRCRRRSSWQCELLFGRRIGIILEFEKAEPELGTGELWRRRLSTCCHVGIFRAWRHSRPDDRCAIGALAPRTSETNRQRHRACTHVCEGQYLATASSHEWFDLSYARSSLRHALVRITVLWVEDFKCPHVRGLREASRHRHARRILSPRARYRSVGNRVCG